MRNAGRLNGRDAKPGCFMRITDENANEDMQELSRDNNGKTLITDYLVNLALIFLKRKYRGFVRFCVINEQK